MKRLAIVLSLLLAQPSLAAITRVGTPTVDSSTAARDTITMSYTVPSGADVMLCGITTTAIEEVTSLVFNTSESLTPIFADTGTLSSDAGLLIFALVSPTATTANVVMTSSTAEHNNFSVLYCATYDGTVTGSVAAATNVGTADEDTAGTGTTSTLSSEGTSGNALVLFGTGMGDSSSPASNNATYTEIFDANTGGLNDGANDAAYYLAEKLSGLPSGVTVTWGMTNEKIAVQIELVAVSAGGSGVYDTAPTVTAQSTTAYTVTGSLDAAGDVYGVACHKDRNAPTIANVQAGLCVDAAGTGTEAAEATDTSSPGITPFDLSLTLAPGTAYPVFDIYATDGTTLTTLADEFLDPPSTCGADSDELCQFQSISSSGVGSPCASFNTATNPDIASPDVLIAPATVQPGAYALTIGTDCQFSYNDGGAGTKQTAWNVAIYDSSAEDYHADDIDGIFNNNAPTDNGTLGGPVVLDEDSAMTTLDICDGFDDLDGDQLTITRTGDASGAHDGAANAAVLTDSGEAWTNDQFVGYTLSNTTDGSSCVVTGNTATTATCTLAGGAENDWDIGDAHTIVGALPAGTSLGGTGSCDLSGTPTTEDETGISIEFTATDDANDSAALSILFYVVNTVTLPDFTAGDLDAAITAMQAAVPWRTEDLGFTASFTCHESEAANEVISQDPVASTEITAFQAVSVSVSLGETTPGCVAIGKGRPKLGIKGARIGM